MEFKQTDLPAALSKATGRFRAISYLSGVLAIAVIVAFLAQPVHELWMFVATAAILLGLLVVTMLSFRPVKRFSRDLARVASLLCQDGFYELSGDLYRTVQHNMESKQELQHLLVKTQKQKLSQTLQSRIRDTYAVAEQAERRLDMEMPYVMVLVHVDFGEAFLSDVQEISKTTFFLKELISMYVKDLAPEVASFQIESDQIGFVVESNANVEQILDVLQEKLASETEYAHFTFVVSEAHAQREPLKTVYESLRSIARYRIPGAKSRVLYEGGERSHAAWEALSEELKGELVSTLQNESVEACKEYVFGLLDRCVEHGGGSAQLQLLCAEISDAIDRMFSESQEGIPEEVGRLADCLLFAQVVTPAQYKKTVGNYIANAVSYLRMQRRYEDHIIGYILDYVEKHYPEDIYLNLFAEKLQLTGAYISAYFKDKMNVNLSDYINHFRIKQAIRLMETTTLKNKEIAEQVGLPNVNTFIRLFKKHMGTTPGEYRKQTVGSNQ
ncbi:MAG: helix-turn-helix domain-containing protein [Oscillospiraceae bacterium]|nr:helix-turn-helix domain-containing protein [Oscillospiraceae bacterium]